MSWNTGKTKLLVEEYREKRILWDLRDPNYKDNRKKVKIWEKLALRFDCSVKEVKDKVKNLRTTFHRYRKKKSRSALSDQWVHYIPLCFLLEVDAPKKGISTDEDINSEKEDDNSEAQAINDSETQFDKARYSPEPDNEEVVLGQPQSQSVDKCGIQGKHSASTSQTPLSRSASREFATPAPQVKKHKKLGIEKEEEARRADEAYEILKKCSWRDEFATFGEHVANEIRKLSWTAQTMTKYHINNVLFDAAMGKFDAPPPTHTFSWSSHSSQSSRATPTPPLPPCTPANLTYPAPHSAPSTSSSLPPGDMPSFQLRGPGLQHKTGAIEKSTERSSETESTFPDLL